jgi:membrane protein required for colicin V production
MYLDIFVIVLVVWALINGWRQGFIKELFNLFGALAGLLIAGLMYLFFHEYLAISNSTIDSVLNVLAFLILVVFLPIGLGFLCGPLTRLVKTVCLGLPNRLLGMALSVVKFVLILSFALNTLESIGMLNHERTEGSALYEPVKGILAHLTGADDDSHAAADDAITPSSTPDYE